MNKVLIEDISMTSMLEALMVKVDFVKGIVMDEGVGILSIKSGGSGFAVDSCMGSFLESVKLELIIKSLSGLQRGSIYDRYFVDGFVSL